MGTAAFALWRCPLCGAPLAGDVTLKCPSGQCFDRAKEGYWHLLPVQNTRTKAPGDSKEMVAARRAFLSAGYYGIFGQALGELCLEYGIPAAQEAPLRLLDAGCGEGWYAAASRGSLPLPPVRWSWPGLILPSPPCGWPPRLCPRPGMRWRPASTSRSKPAGPTCCSTVSRLLRGKSSCGCSVPADG